MLGGRRLTIGTPMTCKRLVAGAELPKSGQSRCLEASMTMPKVLLLPLAQVLISLLERVFYKHTLVHFIKAGII